MLKEIGVSAEAPVSFFLILHRSFIKINTIFL
jgi:hypothetical protein